jgi:hypothetical protein
MSYRGNQSLHHRKRLRASRDSTINLPYDDDYIYSFFNMAVIT